MILMIAIFIISHVCEQPTEWIAQLCFMVRHKNQDCVYLGVWIVWVILYSHFGDKLRTAKYWAQLHICPLSLTHRFGKACFMLNVKIKNCIELGLCRSWGFSNWDPWHFCGYCEISWIFVELSKLLKKNRQVRIDSTNILLWKELLAYSVRSWIDKKCLAYLTFLAPAWASVI